MWRCTKKMFRKESGQIDMVSLILTVVIAAVTMMVGLVVIANMETSMPDITTSALSTSMTAVMENTGTAFNFLALLSFTMGCNDIHNMVKIQNPDILKSGIISRILRFAQRDRVICSGSRIYHRYCRWCARKQVKLNFTPFPPTSMYRYSNIN